jgi:hypothetical protein
VQTFTKALRISEIAKVVMGAESPTLQRYWAQQGAGQQHQVDPVRCFSVVMRGNASLVTGLYDYY